MIEQKFRSRKFFWAKISGLEGQTLSDLKKKPENLNALLDTGFNDPRYPSVIVWVCKELTVLYGLEDSETFVLQAPWEKVLSVKNLFGQKSDSGKCHFGKNPIFSEKTLESANCPIPTNVWIGKKSYLRKFPFPSKACSFKKNFYFLSNVLSGKSPGH